MSRKEFSKLQDEIGRLKDEVRFMQIRLEEMVDIKMNISKVEMNTNNVK